ncbi:GntR family transcriptional regulator [Bacillus solitudinis]|uniref:GntR family transcriptional regulator n=1 Tax=Bacillus solitudinis TaxID=2014074 RepID=UPI001D0D08A2|nr:GntR family transcriptional regulator [Bacillus solitudinis]
MAAALVAKDESGIMISIIRIEGTGYNYKLTTVSLSEVAEGGERRFPRRFYNFDSYYNWLQPLVGEGLQSFPPSLIGRRLIMENSQLDYNSPIPLYHQIKDILVARITDKHWKTGDLIPTEIELMKEFDVSRTTLRQAITTLVNEGLLEKRQGKGTIVKSLKLTGTLGRLTGFAEEIMEKGYLPKSKLLRSEFRDDLFTEKRKLHIPDNKPILLIHRIRFANDEPIAFEKTSWPEEIGNILIKHDLNGAKFYQVLEDNGIYLKKASETISAVNATPYEADLLGVSAGTALLEMTRLSYGINDEPIEFTQTKYRSDRYQYNVELNR